MKSEERLDQHSYDTRLQRLTKEDIMDHLRAAIEYQDEIGGDYDALYDTVRFVLRRG